MTRVSTKIPPGPKVTYPFANLIEFRRDSLKYLKKLSDSYGDITHFRLGPLRVIFLNHPDYIKDVLTTGNDNFVKGRPLELAKEILGEGLLTSEGEFHKRQSRILQPAFHIKMMEAYAPAMTSYTSKMLDKWQDGDTIDMLDEMIRLSTGIAGQTLFNVDVLKEDPEINDSLEDIIALFGRVSMPLAEFSLKIPLPGTVKFYKAKARLNETIYKIIKNRKKNRLNNGDLLSLLLEAQDEMGEDEMTDENIRDEALTLLLTAFDTTSLALTWTWYLLAQHPEIEEELHAELDEVLNGRMPSIDDYNKLKYTRLVFEEAMRLYPPIYVIAREALDDYPIGEFSIPKGSIVLMSPYIMHRDVRYHSNPETFNPWASTLKKGGHGKYEYFPFSAGPRSCIGQHYAWLEGVLVLAAVAQKFKARLVPGHKVELAQLINLRPKNGLKMALHKRDK